MYTSWEQTPLFLKEHLSCIAQHHQCCGAGWKAKSCQRRWDNGHVQPWCWGCFAQLTGQWAARLSRELFPLYLQTSFMKQPWGHSQAQGYFQCGMGTWSCKFVSSRAVHKLDLSSLSLHSLGQGVFLASLGAVVAGRVLLPLTQQLPTLICSLQQLNYSVEGVEQAHGTISALLTQLWWDPHGSKHLWNAWVANVSHKKEINFEDNFAVLLMLIPFGTCSAGQSYIHMLFFIQ